MRAASALIQPRELLCDFSRPETSFRVLQAALKFDEPMLHGHLNGLVKTGEELGNGRVENDFVGQRDQERRQSTRSLVARYGGFARITEQLRELALAEASSLAMRAYVVSQIPAHP